MKTISEIQQAQQILNETTDLPSHSFIKGLPMVYMTECNNLLCADCANETIKNNGPDMPKYGTTWDASPAPCEECGKMIGEQVIGTLYGHNNDTTIGYLAALLEKAQTLPEWRNRQQQDYELWRTIDQLQIILPNDTKPTYAKPEQVCSEFRTFADLPNILSLMIQDAAVTYTQTENYNPDLAIKLWRVWGRCRVK